jgi:hypothetical protein
LKSTAKSIVSAAFSKGTKSPRFGAISFFIALPPYMFRGIA